MCVRVLKNDLNGRISAWALDQSVVSLVPDRTDSIVGRHLVAYVLEPTSGARVIVGRAVLNARKFK